MNDYRTRDEKLEDFQTDVYKRLNAIEFMATEMANAIHALQEMHYQQHQHNDDPQR